MMFRKIGLFAVFIVAILVVPMMAFGSTQSEVPQVQAVLTAAEENGQLVQPMSEAVTGVVEDGIQSKSVTKKRVTQIRANTGEFVEALTVTVANRMKIPTITVAELNSVQNITVQAQSSAAIDESAQTTTATVEMGIIAQDADGATNLTVPEVAVLNDLVTTAALLASEVTTVEANGETNLFAGAADGIYFEVSEVTSPNDLVAAISCPASTIDARASPTEKMLIGLVLALNYPNPFN